MGPAVLFFSLIVVRLISLLLYLFLFKTRLRCSNSSFTEVGSEIVRALCISELMTEFFWEGWWKETGHSVQYDKATVLAHSQGYFPRKYREALEILKHPE